MLLVCLSIITPLEEKLIFGCWQEVRVPRTPVFPSPSVSPQHTVWMKQSNAFPYLKTHSWVATPKNRDRRTSSGGSKLGHHRRKSPSLLLSLTVTWICFQEHSGREMKNNINHKQLWKKKEWFISFSSFCRIFSRLS